MVLKYDFELALEKIAEKFYFNAASALVSIRGGNSRGNEVYFGSVAPDLKSSLKCQQLVLTKKGACPDSGIFGNFGYKHKDEINWDLVRNKKIIVLEVSVPNNQKCYIEVNAEKVNLPPIITEGKKKSKSKDKDDGYADDIDNDEKKIALHLNDLDEYEDFFGVEYKAAVNPSSTSINVASFNSTCPSNTKTTKLKATMIHNYPTKMKKNLDGDKELKKCEIIVTVQFYMYYFVVNDIENGTRSEIKQILLCRGSFFAPTTSQEEAEKLSRQLTPKELKKEVNLYRVGLRYRPFFESRVVQSKGFGIYSSWESRLIGEIAEEEQRKALLVEVEKVQQDPIIDEDGQVVPLVVEEVDNVIYLNLKSDRILRRAA
jgi:hypothetical protein